jgi:hypothetical protein
MRLSEIKGEQALDVLADLLEPIQTIMADDKAKQLFKGGSEGMIKASRYLLKTHKKEVIEIMAITELKTVEEYTEQMSVISLPVKLLEILNDPELQSLFTSLSQNEDADNFGSVSERTEAQSE